MPNRISIIFVLIDRDLPSQRACIAKQLLMYLHDISIPQDFGFVDLLTFEAAVTPKARKFHPLRQVAMYQQGKIRTTDTRLPVVCSGVSGSTSQRATRGRKTTSCGPDWREDCSRCLTLPGLGRQPDRRAALGPPGRFHHHQ